MHYVDEGDGDPILFLHGNPTSCYLWRNVIPYLAPLGRTIAVDLIGMGNSDKPDIEYRFFDHARYVDGFIEALALENVTLVLHDWGSALGFHYAYRHQDNVKALAFMEAIVAPVPSWGLLPEVFQGIFRKFRTPDVGWRLIVDENVFIEKTLPGGIMRRLSEAEMDRYREPFLDPPSRKPLWRWPNEIPIEGEPADVVEAVAAYSEWLQQTQLPKLLLHADPGVILPALVVDWCRTNLPNLADLSVGAGLHFLQEDNPEGIGRALAEWYCRL